uniref:Uncharacterized protein n=1 Tax=Glossina brevipalpis TaxID=37001 RepID=A0A1A9WM62_9MUSC
MQIKSYEYQQVCGMSLACAVNLIILININAAIAAVFSHHYHHHHYCYRSVSRLFFSSFQLSYLICISFRASHRWRAHITLTFIHDDVVNDGDDDNDERYYNNGDDIDENSYEKYVKSVFKHVFIEECSALLTPSSPSSSPSSSSSSLSLSL